MESTEGRKILQQLRNLTDFLSPLPSSPASMGSTSPESHTSSTLEPFTPDAQYPPSTTTLSVDKQKKTRITFHPHIPEAPALIMVANISLCMTLESLFATMFQICHFRVKGQVARVRGFRFTYQSEDENEGGWSVVVWKGKPKSHETLLAEIDNSPCWEKKRGRCDIDVGIVMSETPERSHNTAGVFSASSSTPLSTSSSSPQQQSLSSTSIPLQADYQNPACSTALAAYKQDNTRLIVGKSPSGNEVVVKLRSCMTISSLFDSILAVCDPEIPKDHVRGFSVTHQSDATDRAGWALMVSRERPESFDIFLRNIDEAPCWEKEGGVCDVDVTVETW